MPLKSGKSKKVLNSNIAELIVSKPSKTRNKAIKTLAKKKNISKTKAKRIQAIAIAYDKQKT